MAAEENNIKTTEQGESITRPFDTNVLPEFVDLLPEFARPYWELIQTYPWVEQISIVSIFFFLAFFIRRYAIKSVERFTSKTETKVDDQLIAKVRTPLFMSVIAVGLVLAARTFQGDAGAVLIPITLTYLILIWLQVVLGLIPIILHAMATEQETFRFLDHRTEPLFVIIGKISALVIATFFTLKTWGINPIGLLASAGIVGVAVGFAAKDSLANLLSGVFILVDAPYKRGDFINLDTGERGKVTHIGLRSTRIQTRDDIEVSIPNGVIGNAKIVNESGGRWKRMRVRLKVQVSYTDDLEQVENVLMQIADTEKAVCTHPEARVRVRGFGESGIDIELLCWIDEPADRGQISHRLYMKIFKSFKESGITIPFPQRDLHLVTDRRANSQAPVDEQD